MPATPPCPMANAACGSYSRSTRTARCSTSVSPIASPATSTSPGCAAVDAVAVRHPDLAHDLPDRQRRRPATGHSRRPAARLGRTRLVRACGAGPPAAAGSTGAARVSAAVRPGQGFAAAGHRAALGAEELILLLTAHHIAWDDGSWAPFFTDLTRAYVDPDTVAGAPIAATPGPKAALTKIWPTGDPW